MTTDYTPAISDVIVVAIADRAGADLAEELIARGHRVAVAGIDTARLIPVIRGHDEATIAIVADLTDPDQVRAMLTRVERRLGPVTVMTDPDGAFGSTPWRLHEIRFSAPREHIAA